MDAAAQVANRFVSEKDIDDARARGDELVKPVNLDRRPVECVTRVGDVLYVFHRSLFNLFCSFVLILC